LLTYVDNGASFRAHRLQLGCAALEVGLSYARPYRPQGKGKIERFFRTVRMQFVPELDEGMSLEKINELFFRVSNGDKLPEFSGIEVPLFVTKRGR
jgi:transposase InsO family protein